MDSKEWGEKEPEKQKEQKQKKKKDVQKTHKGQWAERELREM